MSSTAVDDPEVRLLATIFRDAIGVRMPSRVGLARHGSNYESVSRRATSHLASPCGPSTCTFLPTGPHHTRGFTFKSSARVRANPIWIGAEIGSAIHTGRRIPQLEQAISHRQVARCHQFRRLQPWIRYRHCGPKTEIRELSLFNLHRVSGVNVSLLGNGLLTGAETVHAGRQRAGRELPPLRRRGCL